MSWVTELREAFSRLRAREHAHVGFVELGGTVGELGREFNALAETLAQGSANGLTRAEAHALRNRLAGILAALHVLRESDELAAAEKDTLGRILEEAKDLDASLRAR